MRKINIRRCSKSKVDIDEIPNGVSIVTVYGSKVAAQESKPKIRNQKKILLKETPKLFSDERLQEDLSSETIEMKKKMNSYSIKM